MARTLICPQGHAYDAPLDQRDAPCPVCAGATTGSLPMSGSPTPRPLHGRNAAGAVPRFPGYEVIDEVSPGVGGMGIVYKARELSLDRVVALKVVRSPLHTREGLAYFEREAQAAARLDHPNILKVFRFQPEHEPPFYVMQFLEGRGLAQACRSRDYRYIAALIEKVARALAYAHARGVIHRDIKPDNILVDAEDEPFVCDFGVAGRIDGHAAPVPGSATLVGTPAFIAPETYRGGTQVGPTIDVYALGVTLYQVLTGRPPFIGQDLAEVRAQVLRGEPPLPVELNPSVPEPLQRICLKAMEAQAAARYESAAEMADDLRRFCEGREVTARPTRYQARLRGRIQTHLTDIRLWHEQRLIDVRDMDRLSRPYHLLADAASPWQELARRFPWESILLRVGGWLVLISSILWPAFYWHRLTRAERVWSIGAPALVINLFGWLLRARGSRVNSLIYLSTGALLLPLAVSVVLSEYRIAPHTQSAAYEILAHPGPGGGDDYEPTNAQLAISALAFTIYCVTLLLATRATVLAFWVAAGVYLSYTCVLLVLGLKHWVEHEHVARALVLWLPLALSFAPLALVLERSDPGRSWSPVFYAFFPLPFAVLLSSLARYGAVEWFGAEPLLDNETINRGLMLAGIVYLLASVRGSRARLSYVRFWAAVLLLLVPIHLLSPTQLLFARPGHDLFRIGEAPLTTYEAASAVIAVGLILLGTRLRQNVLVLPALLGLAIFFFRATDRHFREYVSWPAAVASLGAAAMLAALISSLLRSRREREPMI